MYSSDRNANNNLTVMFQGENLKTKHKLCHKQQLVSYLPTDKTQLLIWFSSGDSAHQNVSRLMSFIEDFKEFQFSFEIQSCLQL